MTVVKDSENELPVPAAWRPNFTKIVEAFVAGDYELKRGFDYVSVIPQETVDQIQDYVKSYGETLVPLTEETWKTSIYLWMESHWDVLIDLRTEREGRSDLVLSARVNEINERYLIDIKMVYVP